MLSFGALLMLAGSDTASAPVASPSSDPEEAVGTAPPATATKLPLIKTRALCGSPTARVCSPDRLKLLAACVTIKGTVEAIRVEKDGDLHVLLRLDAGEGKYINARNVSGEGGYLVLEPICVRTPTQLDGKFSKSGGRTGRLLPAWKLQEEPLFAVTTRNWQPI